ncbi:MAG: hypothetical protein D4S01_01690 [Dehalococcoidia bacterium]|nr:MAG: hypothetical protein D4S01_01690 [Dehalococcoidia bacterium]
MANTVTIRTGIPGAGKTKTIDQLLRDNPKKRKIYLTFSHNRLDERKDFLKGEEVTHWEGMKRICPLQQDEPIKTWIEIGAPVRWICRLCQSLKKIEASDCPHKRQFKNPKNIVIAPTNYLFTQHTEKYKPDLVVVDDVTTLPKDLPSLSKMRTYVRTLNFMGCCNYKTIEGLFELSYKKLEKEIAKTIEPKLKKVIKNLLKEGSDFSKDTAKLFLEIDPIQLLDWHRVIKNYGWQEEASIPYLMKVFELSLEETRKVIVVGALPHKLYIETLAKIFKKDHGKKIQIVYEKIQLKNIAKSVVYRVRSPKYPKAWYPTTTSIVESRIERNVIRKRIEILLLSLVDYNMERLGELNVGIIKPKKVDLKNFMSFCAEFCHVKSLHFGNLRGSNKLENCNVLIVVGTYKVNLDAFIKKFKKIFHREPWSTDSSKLYDGGYKFLDAELENYRKMHEDDEMYQAIHRCRPALREKKIFVLGLIPKEIREEFEVREITFELNYEGGINVVEWKDPEGFMRKQIGEGIYMAELAKLVAEEEKISKRNAYERIKRFVAKYNDEYEIAETTKTGDLRLKYVKKR